MAVTLSQFLSHEDSAHEFLPALRDLRFSLLLRLVLRKRLGFLERALDTTQHSKISPSASG